MAVLRRLLVGFLPSLLWVQVAASSEEELFRSVEQRDLAALAGCLKEGVSLAATNSRGWPPLILAAKQGDLAAARLLIEHGADVNGRSTASVGSYVIHFAAASGNCDLLRLLAAKGTRLDQLQLSGSSPLSSAIVQGGAASIECLLLLGVDPDVPCLRGGTGEWVTPLGMAAIRQDTNAVLVLLKHGADLERPSSAGHTPLMLAARGTGRGGLVRWFLARGADPKAQGPQGHTALIYAAFHGDMESVEALLAAGADPKALAVDSELEGVLPSAPYSAAYIARKKGFMELADRLIAATADRAERSVLGRRVPNVSKPKSGL